MSEKSEKIPMCKSTFLVKISLKKIKKIYMDQRENKRYGSSFSTLSRKYNSFWQAVIRNDGFSETFYYVTSIDTIDRV